MTDRQYITEDGPHYRVRVPDGKGGRKHVGNFNTIEEATEARDKAQSIPVSDIQFERTEVSTLQEFAHYLPEEFTRRVEAYGSPLAATPNDDIDIPANVNLITEQPLSLTLDRWLYASDFHVPLHNREYIKRLILIGRKRKIRHLVIGGDLYDFDSLSSHSHDSPMAGYRRTKEIAGDLIYLLGNEFELTILPGNHCRRAAKKYDEDMPFADIVYASLAGRVPRYKVTTTDYDYVTVNNLWNVGHPTYYSSTPAKTGADVAMKQGKNIIGAHNHLAGIMHSPCGRYIAIDPGHMSEETLTPYKMRGRGLSKYTAWKNAFVLIEDDIPTLMADGFVDWSHYLS